MFKDRQDAAQQLLEQILRHPLIASSDPRQLLVLSIPRGGVVLGDVISKGLKCDHNIVIVKKIGAPGQSELAIGSMGPDFSFVLDEVLLSQYGIKKNIIENEKEKTKKKINEYLHTYQVPKIDFEGKKVVVLVDDGIATGWTIKTAINWIKGVITSKMLVLVAVPVAPPETVAEISKIDGVEVICLEQPKYFQAIGQFYQNFAQVEDQEVIEILGSHKKD